MDFKRYLKRLPKHFRLGALIAFGFLLGFSFVSAAFAACDPIASKGGCDAADISISQASLGSGSSDASTSPNFGSTSGGAGLGSSESLPAPEKLGLPFEGKTAQASVSGIIQEAIKYVGILAVLSLTYGGFLFMTAFGEDEKIKKAKTLVQYSITGVILSITAYSIVDIVNSLHL
jgi:hypothetical protein